MSNDCVFCREINGSRDTNFATRYPEINSRIIYETDSLIAFPCIGQLTQGHFLVIPRKHYCTFKHVQSHITSLSHELDQINHGVHELLGIQMEDSLFFEHGALNLTGGGCGIYHAHLHVVPNIKKIHPCDIFNFKNEKPFHSIQSAWQKSSINDSYVLTGNLKYGFYCRSIYTPLPSQTLRKNLAHLLGLTEWNWQKSVREAHMISILAMTAR